MTDLDLFTDEAILRGYDNATQDFKTLALKAVHDCALTMDVFTTDNVWSNLHASGNLTHDKRALGGVMRVAVSNGWIQATDQFQNSQRIEAHKNPKKVWRSRLRNAPQTDSAANIALDKVMAMVDDVVSYRTGAGFMPSDIDLETLREIVRYCRV